MSNKWLLVSAFTLTTAALAGDATTGVGSASADVAQQLFALERLWVDAENKRDAQTLNRILDRQYIATFGSGAPLRKDEFIRGITEDESDTMASQTSSDRTLVLDGDTAIVVGTDTIRGSDHGKAYTRQARYTTTYIRRDGRWLALAEHMVEIKPKH